MTIFFGKNTTFTKSAHAMFLSTFLINDTNHTNYNLKVVNHEFFIVYNFNLTRMYHLEVGNSHSIMLYNIKSFSIMYTFKTSCAFFTKMGLKRDILRSQVLDTTT